MGIRASARYLPELESLRGLAITLVFLFHTDGLVNVTPLPQRPPPSLLTAFVRLGNTGVDLFFVLSAFLLSLPFVAEADQGRPLSLRRYFERRALRILPLYWIAITPIIVLTATNWRDVVSVLPLYVLVGALSPPMPRMFPYGTPWWSLVTESQFYLALPLLGLVLRPRTGIWLAIGLVAVWALAYGIAIETPALQTFDSVWLFTSLFGRFPVFVFGIALAVFYARHGDRVRQWLQRGAAFRSGGSDAALLVVVVAMLFLLRWVGAHGYDAERAPLVIWHAAGGALWASIVGLVLVAPLRARPLLCNRALGWLGAISYSVYLWHVPLVWEGVLHVRKLWKQPCRHWDAPTLLAVAVITAVVLACSALSYRFIELPFLRRKAKLE